jgi:uncharacterized membrane protein (DUF4010 family)
LKSRGEADLDTAGCLGGLATLRESRVQNPLARMMAPERFRARTQSSQRMAGGLLRECDV